jgi:hypothetical protein
LGVRADVMKCWKILVFLGMKQEKSFDLAFKCSQTDISPQTHACH